jgi:hypothetical protein
MITVMKKRMITVMEKGFSGVASSNHRNQKIDHRNHYHYKGIER